MKTVVTIVGARPQFIKAAVLSRVIKEKFSHLLKEIIVHTGQHYDSNMSDLFFKEMEIPLPDYNLSVGSGNHGETTAEMLRKIEVLLIEIKPDFVLVYGDTNSTLAGALAASKLNIKVAHVEAGLRSFNFKMPEEQNRIVTDHLSNLLFAPTEQSIENLKNEGLSEKSYLVGDIMYEGFSYYMNLIKESLTERFYTIKKDVNKTFYLLTIHRAESTEDPKQLALMFEQLGKLKEQLIFPMHPRTKSVIHENKIQLPPNIITIDPVGYFDMLTLLKKCKAVITDSGGLQKEAYFAKKMCYTLREQTEWVETVHAGWNLLVKDILSISTIIDESNEPDTYPSLYGNKDTAEKVVNILLK